LLFGLEELKTSYPSEISLGRSFAACFGCIALSISILMGLINGDVPESILTQALTATAAFTVVGWVLGNVADSIVRQSVETNYRVRFEKLREKRNSSSG
jgi:hypothetical protein